MSTWREWWGSILEFLPSTSTSATPTSWTGPSSGWSARRTSHCPSYLSWPTLKTRGRSSSQSRAWDWYLWKCLHLSLSLLWTLMNYIFTHIFPAGRRSSRNYGENLSRSNTNISTSSSSSRDFLSTQSSHSQCQTFRELTSSPVSNLCLLFFYIL